MAARADIDENLIGRELDAVHRHFPFGDEAAMTLVNRAAFKRLQRSFDAVTVELHHGILPRLDGPDVDVDRTLDPDPVIGGAACKMRSVSARGQRLGRSAARVHACAAEQLALDDRDFSARGRQSPRQGRTGLSGANDDRVEVRHRAAYP